MDQTIDKCFVVMPFGVKPFRDGSNKTYDFDKVYRVIMRRAIKEAGMEPARADEGIGSGIIHTDMFKDLRDQPVVLADLSLDNPNVFYELGIRHVMSGKGTVLMCQKGTVLPFDVNLSRVIFYDFDGKSLDWEEVEKIVSQLTLALQQARKGEPDSPVHALLENVMPKQPSRLTGDSGHTKKKNQSLIKYQKLVAEHWKQNNHELSKIYDEQRDSIFGCRALGYYCLNQSSLPDLSVSVARHLVDAEQYELANQIFARLHGANALGYEGLLNYASSYSEANSHIQGANHALKLISEAEAFIDEMAKNEKHDILEVANARASIYRRKAGLKQWKWHLTRDTNDLKHVIKAFEEAIQYMQQARNLGGFTLPGLIAQAHLKLILLLRINDNNVNRPDLENHGDAILQLNPTEKDGLVSVSYLRWYKAIVLADLGSENESRKKAIEAATEDSKLINNLDCWEVGRRQYKLLRRFIEQYSQYFKNPSLLGVIAQILQIRNDPG